MGKWDSSSGIITAGVTGNEEEFWGRIDDVQIAKKIFDSGEAVFVDARNFEAYASGHIKGAVSLPIGQFGEKIDAFRDRYATVAPIVVYCSGRTCYDSHKLAQRLFMEGYADIRIFIDGYPAWMQKGYPCERISKKAL